MKRKYTSSTNTDIQKRKCHSKKKEESLFVPKYGHQIHMPYKQLFTQEEVIEIVEQNLKERELQLQEMFEILLSNSLHEQYLKFSEFNNEYIRMQFNNREVPYIC